MNNDLQDKLEKKINKLKSFIGKFDTQSVLGMIANDLNIVYTGKNLFEDTKLSSPYKQYMYLAGLLLSTDESDKKYMRKCDLKKAKKLLEDICNIYAISFFPDDEEIKKGLGENWYKARKISMPVFLNYFNTTTLSYEEQQICRIKRWFRPYNDFFKQQYKFSVDELLDVYNFISSYIRNSVTKINGFKKKIEESRDVWLDHVKNDGMSFSNASKSINKEEFKTVYSNIINEIQGMYNIPVNKLINEFDKLTIKSFLKQFSLDRKDRNFRYYTENNPFEVSPLWRKSKEYIFCPVYKQLLNAIFYFLYGKLEKSEYKRSFYKNRDNESEKQTTEIFMDIFGNKANYYNSVFERDDSQNEHDLLITYKDKIIIVEVKASKLREPFRNPDKAYNRIKDDFKSDSGIQKAYYQGLNLKKLFLCNQKTNLYDKKGNTLVNINMSDYNKIYIFCITAENFNILSCQLSLLLEKPIEEPYPWACNIYDIENIANAFKYKNLGPEDFLNYIDNRIQIHEKLFSTDELEICGYYLKEGNFDKINKEISQNNLLVFTPEMSDIFDEIYFKQKGLDIKYNEYDLNINSLPDKMKYEQCKINTINVRKDSSKKNKNKKKMIKESKIKNRNLKNRLKR